MMHLSSEAQSRFQSPPSLQLCTSIYQSNHAKHTHTHTNSNTISLLSLSHKHTLSLTLSLCVYVCVSVCVSVELPRPSVLANGDGRVMSCADLSSIQAFKHPAELQHRGADDHGAFSADSHRHQLVSLLCIGTKSHGKSESGGEGSCARCLFCWLSLSLASNLHLASRDGIQNAFMGTANPWMVTGSARCEQGGSCGMHLHGGTRRCRALEELVDDDAIPVPVIRPCRLNNGPASLAPHDAEAVVEP